MAQRQLAVGEEVVGVEQKPYDGHWAEIVLHSQKDGRFVALDIDDEFYQTHVKQVDLWVKENEKVNAFKGANDAIGTLVLNFDDEASMLSALENPGLWLKIHLK